MNRLTRRQFLQVATANAAGVLAAGALAGCAAPEVGTPSRGPETEILRNENVPGFYVRYYKPFPAPDPARWRLRVEGLVAQPLSLSLEDIQTLPSAQQIRRLKCVECWSARAKWEGFSLASLMEVVKVQPDVRWVHFFCADDYHESLSIEELSEDGVLLAYRVNDALLPAKYGSPLRLVVPSRYGYKWPKAIARLEFARDEKIGYWPTVGPYTSSGVILPGSDYPLDLPDGSRPIDGGEVIYPEDLQAPQASQ